MPKTAEIIDGKKFMWNQENYETEADAKEKTDIYEKEGFETRIVLGDNRFLVYSRRVVTEIILEEGAQPL